MTVRRTPPSRARRRPPRVAGTPQTRPAGPAGSGPAGSGPGYDDEFPTDTFDSVLDDAPDDEDGREHDPEPTAEHDDDPPTQVIDAIRDEAPAEAEQPIAEQLFGGHAGADDAHDTAFIPRIREDDPPPGSTDAQDSPTPPSPPSTPGAGAEAHTEQFAAYRADHPEDGVREEVQEQRAEPVESAEAAAEQQPGAPAEPEADQVPEATPESAATDAEAPAPEVEVPLDKKAAKAEAKTAKKAAKNPATPDTERRRAPVLLVMLLLVLAVGGGGGAWLFDNLAGKAAKQRPTSNIALLDKGATTQAIDQVSQAVEAIYSYDAANLDQSEARALTQITGSYKSEFERNFASVRALGPEQRASLTSKVVAAGVMTLTERRASLLVMVDQVGRRGDNPQPVKAAVRLSVTAQRVDGQWKVSGVNQK